MSKILIIEDNSDVAGLLKDLFVAQGFEVFVCEDGYQGVEFTHNKKPDLILLDLMLPAGGGFYVLEKVRLSILTKMIPVVVLTASRDAEHKKKAEQLGVQGYIEKPYDSKHLVATVKVILGSEG